MADRNIHRGGPAVMLLALLLAGCTGFGFGSSKKPPEPASDPNVFPAKYRAEIADFLRTYLINPTKVRDAFISVPALKQVGASVHYVVCVRYNPRDSDNRYTGSQDRLAVFWGGRLNQFLPGNPELCAGAAYQPFPEAEALVP